MIWRPNLRISSTLMMGIFFLILSCGKEPKVVETAPEIILPPQEEIHSYLAKQDITCESTQACPTYITKLVIRHGNGFKFCTGFLIDKDTVATSSSCLPNILKLSDQDCSQDVFFFFPKTANRPAERASCNKVSLVSSNDEKDPILWRDDIAFLNLSRPLPSRRHAQIIREGIQNNKDYIVWMIDQQGEYTSIVKRANCSGLHNSYVNPLAVNESSPGMLMADCQLTPSASGSPVIDSRGKVRAMISRSIDRNLRRYLESTGLLIQSLKEMAHATNFACAPTPSDNEMLEERECLKDLNYSMVDRERAGMLSTSFLFSEVRKKYEESLQGISSFVRFGVKFIPNGDYQGTEIYPKCFRPYRNWLPSMSSSKNIYVDNLVLPIKSFRRGMDNFGRIQAITIEEDKKRTYVQFSLKYLRSNKKSSILMWDNSSSNNLRTFQNISEDCSESLL